MDTGELEKLAELANKARSTAIAALNAAKDAQEAAGQLQTAILSLQVHMLEQQDR